MNSKDLRGKVIIVTGGSRGIGRRIVRDALARGSQVAYCARSIDSYLPASGKKGEWGNELGHLLAIRADVSQENDVDTLFEATLDRFGHVDVVINNAAISHDSLLVSLSVADWDDVIATNLTGAFLVTRRAIQVFLAAGQGGKIISVGSLVQNGTPSNAVYAASKGGLVGLTRSIAAEYGPRNIDANLVVVGYVQTELTQNLPEQFKQALVESCPQRRPATATEIANVVLFLASARTVINGSSIYITGGLREVPL